MIIFRDSAVYSVFLGAKFCHWQRLAIARTERSRFCWIFLGCQVTPAKGSPVDAGGHLNISSPSTPRGDKLHVYAWSSNSQGKNYGDSCSFRWVRSLNRTEPQTKKSAFTDLTPIYLVTMKIIEASHRMQPKITASWLIRILVRPIMRPELGDTKKIKQTIMCHIVCSCQRFWPCLPNPSGSGRYTDPHVVTPSHASHILQRDVVLMIFTLSGGRRRCEILNPKSEERKEDFIAWEDRPEIYSWFELYRLYFLSTALWYSEYSVSETRKRKRQGNIWRKVQCRGFIMHRQRSTKSRNIPQFLRCAFRSPH